MVRFEGMMGLGMKWCYSHPYNTPLTNEEFGRIRSIFGGWRFWPWQEAEQRFLEVYHTLSERIPQCT
jgi:hypothetical protein